MFLLPAKVVVKDEHEPASDIALGSQSRSGFSIVNL